MCLSFCHLLEAFSTANVFLWMTCDQQYIVTGVEAKWPGSVHDFWQRLEERMATVHWIVYLIVFFKLILVMQYSFCWVTPPSPFWWHLILQQVYKITWCGPREDQGQDGERFWNSGGRASLVCKAKAWARKIIRAHVVLHNTASIRRERAPPVSPQPPLMWRNPSPSTTLLAGPWGRLSHSNFSHTNRTFITQFHSVLYLFLPF